MVAWIRWIDTRNQKGVLIADAADKVPLKSRHYLAHCTRFTSTNDARRAHDLLSSIDRLLPQRNGPVDYLLKIQNGCYAALL
jgi:hypothetical protein